MKVVYVVNNFDFFLSHRVELAKSVMSLGHEVHVIGPIGKNVQKVTELGFKSHLIPMKRTGTNPFSELVTIFFLFWKLRKIHADLVNAIALKASIYTALVSPFLNCKKIVCTITGLGFVFISDSLWARILRLIVTIQFKIGFNNQKIDLIFQNSDDQKLFCNRGWGLPKQMHLVPGSGVDIKKFKSYPEQSGKCKILFAGRILRDKGIYELIQAAKLLKAEGISFELELAGEIDEKNPARALNSDLEEWQREGIAKWIGPQKDMVPIYRNCHIVCLPSYREGLSLTLLEAAASGRAILTTDTPGCRDVIENGESGLLVAVKDVMALKNELMKLILNPMLRQKLGRAARKRAENKFSRERILSETLSVYGISSSYPKSQDQQERA